MTKKINKDHLRTQLRQRRRGLGEEERFRAARELLELVENEQVFQKAKSMACYIPADGEINTLPIIEKAWQLGKQVFVPAINTSDSQEMLMLEFNENTPCVENQFGLQEPAPGSNRAELADLELIIVPMLGFNNRIRLGMGGGFYDRFLAKPSPTSPFLLGVAHRCQYSPDIRQESWDVLMDKVIAV